MRIPFAINSYQARSLPLSAQRLVNLYPEAAPADAKAPLVLYGTPGLKLFATCGAGPIRGLHNFAGTLCAVSDLSFYTVTEAGVATNQGSVGALTDATMQDNGAQLMIVAGNAATGAYMWNGTTVAQITDADYPGAEDVAFIDGYHVVTRPGTDEFYWSALNDCTSWDGADYASAEGQPDDLVGVIADHRELWLFGSVTTEIWYNSGSPFDRFSGAYLERGCAAKGSIAKADNSVYWLGDDRIVYRAAGYTPQRVSTHAIEYAIENYSNTAISNARAFTYTQEGHTFYVLTFDDATFVYDAAVNLWHERDSRHPTTGESLRRWRADCAAECYGKILVGDYSNGNIYELDMDTYTENGTEIQRLATSAPIHASGARAVMSRLEVEIESGAGLTSGQGSDPKAMLQWSDDGGRTWGNEHWAGMGKIGEYRHRAIWNRLGGFRQRVLRLVISDPITIAVTSANVDVK